MNTFRFVIIIVAVALASFAGGYSLSASTGTEPGYFEAVEAAGYGGGGDAIEGISKEMNDYYKSLENE